jgi:carbon monoxide dehydrogenase subunit G
MKVSGQAVLNASPQAAWDALLDPAVLVRTIPGCERLEATGENTYAMTVNAGVAAIKGTYSGTVELRDLDEPRSLIMRAAGAGGPGTIDTSVEVRFTDDGDDGTTTRVDYDADAVVGGMLGGVGQRMLTSVSKRMAGEFFGAVDAVLTGNEVMAPTASDAGVGVAEAAPGTVFTAPPRPASDRDEFVKGIVVGAGLVLLGVLAGAVAGRRRR